MRKLLKQILTPFRRTVGHELTAEEMLLEHGFSPVQEDSGEARHAWRRKMLEGYLLVRCERFPDGVPLPDSPLWSVRRHHYNGGHIIVRNIHLLEALDLRLPEPISLDGSPVRIDTDSIENLDVLWFMASRARGGSGDAPSSEGNQDNLISLTAARLRRDRYRHSGSRCDNHAGGGADIIEFGGNGRAS